MFYGYYPAAPWINVVGAKLNGIGGLGTGMVGPLLYWDANANTKTNSANQIFGDMGYTPTVWGFISDPDALDAPVYHGGFF